MLVCVGAILAAGSLGGSALVTTITIDQPDAIVSLASHEWERLPIAAALALKYPDAQVLLTLPPDLTQQRCHDCAQRVDYLVRQGVARDRIAVVPIVESSTRGEARAIGAVVRSRSLHRVLIVTSAYHTRRALNTFRRELEKDTMVLGITPAGVGQFAVPSRWWSRPYDRWYVSYEWAALARDVGRQLIGK